MNIEIIPAMDLIDGACVRLAQGDYDRRTTYGGDPLDTALRFEAAGLLRLHMREPDAPSAAASPCANPTAWPRGWRSSAASV